MVHHRRSNIQPWCPTICFTRMMPTEAYQTKHSQVPTEEDWVIVHGGNLTDKGVKPDPRKQDSIQAMPAPANKEEVRRHLGVVTYQSRFSEALSTKSALLRTLLKNNIAFTWEANEQQAFDEMKALISSAPQRLRSIMTTNHLLQYSSNQLGRIPLDFKECFAELWDMTLTSSTSKAKTY